MSRLKATGLAFAVLAATAAIAVPMAIGQNDSGSGSGSGSNDSAAPDLSQEMQKFQQCMSEQGIEPPTPPEVGTEPPSTEPPSGEPPEPPEGLDEALKACADYAPEGGPGPGEAGGPVFVPPPGMPGGPECDEQSKGSNDDASAAPGEATQRSS